MTQPVDKELMIEFLPLLPLKDIVIFPQMIIPVFVSEDICLKAVEAACNKNRTIFLSAFKSEQTPRDNEGLAELRVSTPVPFDVYDIGTIANILRTRKLPDGRTKVLIQGVARARVMNLYQTSPYPIVEVRHLNEISLANEEESETIAKFTKEQLEKAVTIGKSLSPDILMLLEDVKDIGKLADIIASNLNLKVFEAQKILGNLSSLERLKRIHLILSKDFDSSSSPKKLFPPHKEEQKNPKDFALKEQLKVLKQELGDSDSKDEIEELKDKIIQSGMSPEARAESLKQIRRLERMNQDSSEASLTRTYIEWLLDLPWNKSSDSVIEMNKCKETLDQDHYGLDKIKDRILEYMAVKKLNPELRGPILCFVGPPGVGKTSLGKSIAAALNRKFVRISLGGVRDEAEIRGHRRTYVGAMPGRIILAMKNAGVNNPVLMLDEIDKLSSDYKGDPSSALLEVLDPEQNHTFSDHYIGVPYDLSQVIFLANANRLDTIPGPLRDRLEIIEVSGYSEEEKLQITKQYIIPKVLEQNGLNSNLIQFIDSAIALVINSYTRESGLRNLERNMATIARKCARFYAENDEKDKERKLLKITPKYARELLGEERFIPDDLDLDARRTGVCIGLAYTQAGGEILEMEVKLAPGNGKLILTGQLGDIMKESAQTAYTCIRSMSDTLGIDASKFAVTDVHVHVPAGAVPKDGPSAGIALSMSLISAFKNIPTPQNIAMTGEITLNGKILPIGGLKEKLLAAIRYGIHKAIVPEKNRGTYQECPLSIKRKIDVVFVSTLPEALEHLFGVMGETKDTVENLNKNVEVPLNRNENLSVA